MEFSSISTLSSSTSSLSDLEACVSQALPSSHSTTTRRRSKYMINKSYTTFCSSSSSSSSSSSFFKALAGSPSPRSVTSMFFYDSLSDDEPRHFLDSCFLCNKALSGGNRDIFMYGGDMPFCSEDCRQKKIDLDEKEEEEKEIKKKKKKNSFSSSIKSFQSSYLTEKSAQDSFWR